ncbi:unnamed protein product, partial [Timema podura]|nr:unnamed protein product [Timema podura]
MLAYIRWSARSLVPVFIRSQKVCVCSLRTEISCTGGSVIRHSHLHREHPRSTFLDTFRRFKFDGNPLQCWNCGGRDATKQLFCSRCKVLQRPEQSSTYFDIIGVAPTYNVSLSELTSRYRMLQSSLHPDRFSNRSERGSLILTDTLEKWEIEQLEAKRRFKPPISKKDEKKIVPKLVNNTESEDSQIDELTAMSLEESAWYESADEDAIERALKSNDIDKKNIFGSG